MDIEARLAAADRRAYSRTPAERDQLLERRNLERQRARAARRAVLLRYVPTADELADRLVASGDLNDAAREAGQPVEEAAYEVALCHLAADRDSAAQLYAQLTSTNL